jgi:hypothetical protein
MQVTAKVVYAPDYFADAQPEKVNLFLAGSIEMGKAADWQYSIGEAMTYFHEVGNIYNPRRLDWDSSWKQSIDDFHFNMQVNWELNHIERADIVFFNFIPDTMSPITLAELGLVLGAKKSNIIVCCPDGFWRQGNVEIMCHRAGIKMFRSYQEAFKKLMETIHEVYEEKRDATRPY